MSTHPDPATAAWADYIAAGEAYRAANTRLIQTCLMGLAVTIRDSNPSATHVILGVSDQGPHLTLTAVIDPECNLDDNEVEYDDVANVDNLDSYATDLSDEDPFGDWQPFVIADPDPDSFLGRAFSDVTGRYHSYVLDLDLILFCEGDAARAVALTEVPA